MNALLYLGVPMMAKFSPELNMVRSDAYRLFIYAAGMLHKKTPLARGTGDLLV
jgi:hypothetical protein